MTSSGRLVLLVFAGAEKSHRRLLPASSPNGKLANRRAGQTKSWPNEELAKRQASGEISAQWPLVGARLIAIKSVAPCRQRSVDCWSSPASKLSPQAELRQSCARVRQTDFGGAPLEANWPASHQLQTVRGGNKIGLVWVTFARPSQRPVGQFAALTIGPSSWLCWLVWRACEVER